ncbi:hypothetical protein [Streptomyces sp. NPDC051576]|uniref:hypothetical protein n=1 Tax=Streptomyces sp. NPDC051576 TaxID=3155803 RepID=UPI003429B3A1
MSDHVLRLLREHAHLAELAAFPFDFDLRRAEHGEPVRLASGGPLRPVAGDDTGGTYFVCADGSVLYADSEGSAGIIGSSVDEAVEIVIGLPGWRDHLDLSPSDGPEKILAQVTETEDEFREDYGIDEARPELRAALGLSERSPVELIGMLHASLLRTEPDFLLLNAEEGCAYDLFDRHPRPPLWEPVLAQGRADLAALRAGDPTVWDATAEDPVRRRLALRAAQFDRADGDLELLRHLLRYEAAAGMTDELRLAALLVGLRGHAEDLRPVYALRERDFDAACGLSEMPGPDADGAALREWAEELDDSLFGADPSDEPLCAWTELAADQGLTEVARAALIRRLDTIEMDRSLLCRPGAPKKPGRLDPSPLGALAQDFEQLGDRLQALRAQRLYAALQDTEWDRVSARLTQARLERETDQLPQAGNTLATLRDILDSPADDSLRHLHRVGLGRFVAEEHYALTRALADADLREEARATLAAADEIRGRLSGAGDAALREFAAEATARVRDFS